MCTSSIEQGREECEWFPDFQGASCKSHTFLCKKKEVKTLCSWVELKSPFWQVVSYRSKVHSIYTAELVAAAQSLAPWPCVNVRHNHVNSSHVHPSKVYRAGPPLHNGTEGLTRPCFHGSCSLMEIISTQIPLTERSSWARYCSWSSICINSFNP